MLISANLVQLHREEYCSDSHVVRGIAHVEVTLVEDWTAAGGGRGADVRHERLNEAKESREAAWNGYFATLLYW